MAGGRPQKTLLERVRENSFRPKRYGELLAGELLPDEPPRGFRSAAKRKVWARLLEWQQEWQLYAADGSAHGRRQMVAVAREFSELVRHLHSGARPGWLARLER